MSKLFEELGSNSYSITQLEMQLQSLYQIREELHRKIHHAITARTGDDMDPRERPINIKPKQKT